MLYCVHLFVPLGMVTHPCKKKLQGILFIACVGITEKILSVHACYYVLLGFFSPIAILHPPLFVILAKTCGNSTLVFYLVTVTSIT